MRTLAIVLNLIVVEQRVGVKNVDSVFAMAMTLAVFLIRATIVVY